MGRMGFLLGVACILGQMTGGSGAEAGQAERDLLGRLYAKEQVFFGINADVRRLLNDPAFEEDLRRWWTVVNPSYFAFVGQEGTPASLASSEHYELRKAADGEAMRNAIPSEKVRIYLSYFLKSGQLTHAQALLRIYALEYSLHEREIVEDPRNSAKNLKASSPLYVQAAEYENCVEKSGDVIRSFVCLNAKTDAVAACVNQYQGTASMKKVAQCVSKALPMTKKGKSLASLTSHLGARHVVSPAGFVAGNEIHYFSENRHDQEYVKFFEDLYRGDANPMRDALPGKGEIEDFTQALKSWREGGAFPLTGKPGFLSADEHPAFQPSKYFGANEAIFPELLKGIRSAKHTIFMDIFFFGGTLGAAFARELILQAEKGVKIMILRDLDNPFTYEEEMKPIFNLLMAYSLLHPDRMTVVQAYIYGHRTGWPQYFDALLPDSVMRGLADALQLGAKAKGSEFWAFPKAKSEHSKVVAIDATGIYPGVVPTVYVGSKNLTDSSGALTFDDVTRVKGPAAVVVQDSYYWDLWYALRAGGGGRDPMIDTREIEKVLAPFDSLGRVWVPALNGVVPTRKELSTVGAKSGGSVVRTGENNIDGSLTGALDQDIQAIRSAKKQIIINDQYLCDRRVVEELLLKASREPSVQIYIALEPLDASGPILKGFPNTLYMDLLSFKGYSLDPNGNLEKSQAWPNIHVMWKKVPRSDEFHYEYHMKSITVDGFDSKGRRVGGGMPVLIAGSANKDQVTMSGAFREMQVEVFSEAAVAEADRQFWKRYHGLFADASEEGLGMEGIDPFDFKIPAEIQEIFVKHMGREATPPEFIRFVRELIHRAFEMERSAAVE